MARIDDLEFRITATTDTLRADLNRGSQQIDQFTSRTSAQFNNLGNRFTQVAGKLRGIFALFGVGFGVRALSGWVKSAFEIDKLTASQFDRLKGIKSSMETINESAESLTRTIGFGLLPYLEKSAKFWAAIAERGDSSNVNNRIASIQEQITQRQESLIALRTGKSAPARGSVEDAISRLEADVRSLQSQRAAIEGTAPELTRGEIERRREAARLQEINVTSRRATTFSDLSRRPAGFNAMPRLDPLLQEMTAPSRITSFSQMRGNAGMNAMPTATQVQAVSDAWDKYTENMESAKRQQEDFAAAFAATFESRGMEALIGGDLSGAVKGFISDLAQLILRMKVLQPLANSIGGAFGSGVSGGAGGGAAGFFANLFGGARAQGGPVNPGKAYTVGERGREWFVPDVAGRIMNASQMAGGGSSVVVNQSFYTAAGLPPQWEAAQAMSTRRAASEAYKAVMATIGKRR